MGFFQRVSRVIRANLNSWVSNAEDPEKILEQAVDDMQNDLIEMRQGVAQAIATQKRTERQYHQAKSTADEWYKRAQLALQKGEEDLAREALSRRRSYQETADSLSQQLPQQQAVVDNLRQNMVVLERKIADAKTKKDMYIARARSAKASQQLHEMLDRVGTSSAMQAFERMEERVHELEARSEVAAELGRDDLAERFAALEGGSVDDELAAMKAQLSGRSPSSLPASGAQSAAVDADLEELRSKIDRA
jgi:phage shock protein A